MASFLQIESVSGVLALPGYDPMPGGLDDRTSFPVLEVIVCGDTEVDAPRVPAAISIQIVLFLDYYRQNKTPVIKKFVYLFIALMQRTY